MSDLNDEDDATAGELALGVLEGDERRAAEARAAREPAFAAAVAAWQVRLGPLFEGTAETAPSDLLWARIARRIADPSALARAVARWRAAAVGLGAAAAALAVVLVTRPPEVIVQPPAPPGRTIVLVTQLADDKGNSLLVASYDPTRDRLLVRTNNLPVDTRRPELWVIGADGTPRSLGLVTLNGGFEAAPAAQLRPLLQPGVTFAVTMEPAAGAPHAAPTGTILGTGKLARL